MRRVRSQLNNLAPSGQGGYPASAGVQPPVGFNRQTDEVQRRIDSMGLYAHGDPSVPPMYGHGQHFGDYPMPPYAYPAAHPQQMANTGYQHPVQSGPELENIKSSLDRLTSKLQILAQESRNSANNSGTSGNGSESMVSDGISSLKLAMEADHNAILEELRKSDSGIDPVAYARTVETSHGEVINHLTALEKQIAAATSGSSSHAKVVTDYHRDVVGLINELKSSIKQLENRAPEQPHTESNGMQSQLEELTRAVMALSSRDAGLDNLDRIEARIGDLHKIVDQAGGSSAQEDNASTVSNQIQDVIQMLGQMETNVAALGPRSDSGLDGLAAKINRLSEKIDNISAIGGSQNGPEEGGSALLERLDTLVERVEGIKPETSDPALLHSIESQINRLSDQMEAMAGAKSGSHGASAVDFQPVLDRLNQLEDSLGGQPGLAVDETLHASLEQHLSSIANRLNSLDAGAPSSFGAIEEKLTGIEEQLGASRDITIELATQAAQDAVQSAVQAIPQSMDASGAVSTETINMLAEDLRLLNERTANLNGGNSNGMDFLKDALENIATRLNNIETGLAGNAVVHESVSELAAGHVSGDVPTDSPALDHPQMGELPEIDPPSLEIADIAAPHESDAIPSDDMPLEPGSGTPDLAELVRQANNRRTGSEEDNVSSGTDFIAAARRAAQAAAAEANMVEEEDAEKTRQGKKSGLASLLKRRKKVIMMAAAVALMVALAAPYAGQLVGGIKDRIAGDSVPQTAPIEQSMQEGDKDPGLIEEVEVSEVDGQETLVDEGSSPVAEEQSSYLADADNAVPTSVPTAAEGGIVEAEQISFGSDTFKQAVRDGDPMALFEVARHYTDGIGVDKDMAQAARWYEKSASLGFAPAQYLIGNFNEKGIGVEINNQNAASWYSMAAEKGNIVAMHNLAVMHATPGKLSEKPNMQEAFKWFNEAASHGVRDSQVNVGIFHTNGAGPDGVDLVQAYKWFAVAAKAGDSDAGSKRDIVANAMRPDQLEQARAEAELWRPSEPNPAANDVKVPDEWKSGVPASTAAAADDSIRLVQSMLAKLGFDPGPADGVMGKKTRDAIAAFQKRAGMSVDGQINVELMEALKAVSI